MAISLLVLEVTDGHLEQSEAKTINWDWFEYCFKMTNFSRITTSFITQLNPTQLSLLTWHLLFVVKGSKKEIC